MAITVDGDTLTVTYRENCEGYRPTSQTVRIVPHDEFERIAEECKPSRFFEYGIHAGNSVDGLVVYTGASGVRYLAQECGHAMDLRYADADSLPAVDEPE